MTYTTAAQPEMEESREALRVRTAETISAVRETNALLRLIRKLP